MLLTRTLKNFITILILALSHGVLADELMLTLGGGPQFESQQHNRSYGLDYSFHRIERSYRQHFLLGISFTHVGANSVQDRGFSAISIYPQINLYPRRQPWGQPYFFVRALGPSYISKNRLGSRWQDHHFAFQAQVGIGAYLNYREKEDGIITLSFKHFSNANLFKDNDGIDLPFLLSVGLRF